MLMDKKLSSVDSMQLIKLTDDNFFLLIGTNRVFTPFLVCEVQQEVYSEVMRKLTKVN